MERSYVMLKPDTVKRKFMGKVISRIEEKGFTITAMKMMTLSEEIIKKHYANVLDKPFFPELAGFIGSGPVVAMIVEGEGVVEGMRRLMGPTQWRDCLPGTIRGDFGTSTNNNIIHGSDSPENAEIEIARFFGNN